MEINDVNFLIPLDPFTKSLFTSFIIESVIITGGFPTPLSDTDKQTIKDFVSYIAEDMDRTITVFCKFLDFWGF